MRLRVLVVDDEEAVLKAVRRALFGHDVVPVLSAAAAIAVLQSGERFDVAIVDVVMPVMDGEELVRRLPSIAPDLVHRVLFLTGSDAVVAKRTVLGRPLFVKPIDTQRLRSSVEQLIRPTGVRRRVEPAAGAEESDEDARERPTLPPAAGGERGDGT